MKYHVKSLVKDSYSWYNITISGKGLRQGDLVNS